MIRVVVVDDQTLVREGIIELLRLAGIETVGEAGDGASAIEVITAQRPDVILLDLRMPGTDGLWTLQRLGEEKNTTPVLVLTTFDDTALVLDALRAGARGYLLKDITIAQLKDAVHTMASGGNLIAPAITERLLRASSFSDIPAQQHTVLHPELTARERDVMRLMASGYSNAEIAQALVLAPGTVKNHVSAILLKLGAKDRTNAVLVALHNDYLL